MSKKKPFYPVSLELNAYLKEHNRDTHIPIYYEDLLRFTGFSAVTDKAGNDTLWIRVFYSESDRSDIETDLKRVYNILHSDGNEDNLAFLSVDAIDYCTFGNSKPFRVKIRNVLNDNYTYFYVKRADASRIYGLELEHFLSPYNLNFLVHKDTLIEEHIAGIPGDNFIEDYLSSCTETEKSQIAKEFVKFNERCMIRLLGDMRSYNYVITPVHDFDHVVYRIRAIDFDQQSYEGNLNVYKPEAFSENDTMVRLVKEKLQTSSVRQYKVEERSIIAKRIINAQERLSKLLVCMQGDELSPKEHVMMLKKQVYELTRDNHFRKSETMGEIVKGVLNFVKRNYENISTRRLLRPSK